MTAKVREVGRFVREARKTLKRTHISHKADGSIVSEVDKEAEGKLVEELSKLLPEAGFLTEEKTIPSQPYEDWVWIVDPIDGTFNFVHDVAPYCVNVGLTYHEDIVLGVTYEVLRDECFYAVKEHGAFCNDIPIQVSTCQDFSCALIGLGFSNRREEVDRFLSVLNILSQRGVGFRRTGSVAANMAYVACGRFEGLLGRREFSLGHDPRYTSRAGGQRYRHRSSRTKSQRRHQWSFGRR